MWHKFQVNLFAVKNSRHQHTDRASPQTYKTLHYRQLHALKLHSTVSQHAFYHGILADFTGEYLLAQFVEDDALHNALERTRAELRVEALLA
jgi:hypothetical protein